jgi:hypothetical protein
MSMSGGCLCGAVRYVIRGEPQFTGKCYCKDCQKESGTGHLTLVAVPDAAVEITGNVKQYIKSGGSGQSLERSFCPVCGTTVFARPQVMAGLTMIRAGTLDDTSAINPEIAIYGSRATHWDQPPAGWKVFPETPPAR